MQDSVSISVSYYFPDPGIVPLEVSRAAIRFTERGDGSVILALGRSTVENSNAEARQEEFLKVEGALFAEIERLKVSTDFLSRNRGELHLRLTLSPITGQAGIVLTRDLITRWNNLGAEIYLDAFPD